MANLDGGAEIGLPEPNLLPQELDAGLLKFLRADAVFLHGGDLIPDGLGAILRLHSGPQEGVDVKQARAAPWISLREDLGGELFLLHQMLIEPGALSLAEHIGQYAHSVVIRRVAGWNVIGHQHQGRPRQRVLDRFAPLTVMRGFGHVDGRRYGLRRNAAEVLLHFRQRFGGIQIPHQRDHGVVRRVVDAEEVLHILHRSCIQVGHIADDRVLVGKVVVGEVFDVQVGVAVRLIVFA